MKAGRAESESAPPSACWVVNCGTIALGVLGGVEGAGGLRCSFLSVLQGEPVERH